MIVTDLDTLQKVSKEFEGTEEELDIIINMLEKELKDCKLNGVGLAMIQIGFPVRVSIIRTSKLKLDLVNPVIIGGSRLVVLREGCLSFPNEFINVRRQEDITVRNGDGEVIILSGFEAQAVQHEIDHFNGLTMFDREV